MCVLPRSSGAVSTWNARPPETDAMSMGLDGRMRGCSPEYLRTRGEIESKAGLQQTLSDKLGGSSSSHQLPFDPGGVCRPEVIQRGILGTRGFSPGGGMDIDEGWLDPLVILHKWGVWWSMVDGEREDGREGTGQR